MRSTVTICVLTYNRPEMLEECLLSIFAQTYNDFEVFVLDNASDLDNKSIVGKFCDKRLQYVRYNENVGPEGNFARAINEYRSTKYLMVYHDDDIMAPHLLEREVEALESHCNLAFASSSFESFIGNAPASFSPLSSQYEIMPSSCNLAKALLMDFRRTDFGSVLYRSAALRGVHIEDYWERFAIIGDRPLLFDLARRGGCALLEQPHSFRRLHSNQDSGSGRLREDHIIALYLSYRRALKEEWSKSLRTLYFRHTALGLPYFYYRWMLKQNRGGLISFLRKSHEAGVLDYSYLPYALWDAGRHYWSKLWSPRRHI